MSFDGIVTRSVVQELNNTILGGRITKIYQPVKNEILLNIYAKGNSKKLLISASSNKARIHLTEQGRLNPSSPPMFCMLLRKHLSGATILNIGQHDMDRVVLIDVSSNDEFGQLSEKRLVIEIMGKHSNIILIDKQSLRIIDSIKRVPISMSRVRQVLPSLEYGYPKQDGKTNPLELDKYQFLQNIEQDNGNKKVTKFFYTNYLGLGPLISKEICFKSDLDWDRPLSSLSYEEREKLFVQFLNIMDQVKKEDYKPLLIKDRYNDNYLAFYSLDLTQLESNKIQFDSISKAIDLFYSKNDTMERISQKSKSMRKSIQVKLDRLINKLAKQKQELLNSKDREKYKIYADLISANIHNISRGLNSIELDNFYSETMDRIKIPLNKKYSPVENAQGYYKKYSRLKNANRTLLQQIPETQKEIYYLENVLNSLDNCTEVIEIDEIKKELIKEGYLKGIIRCKRSQNLVSKPYHYISSDGFHIYVGKNNKQNDNLTLRIAKKEDLWFHAQKIPGSHVIIRSGNDVVPEKSLEEAALLAAYYSKGKNSTKIAVDFTKRKYVNKPKNAKAGMVIYENFETIIVSPRKEYINNIKKIKD